MRAVHACSSGYGLRLWVNPAERRIPFGILFIFSLPYEYSNLDYVHIHVICRVKGLNRRACVGEQGVFSEETFFSGIRIRKAVHTLDLAGSPMR